MTRDVTQTDMREEDGVLVGPYRSPRNMAADQRGSIHDDATATKLGFRGGTVAGSIHMDQFPPLLVRAFGERWFQTGNLSTYFRNATTDGEPVQAFVRLPEGGAADAQVDVWMERDDGTRVLDGTAAAGPPGGPTMLRRMLDARPGGGELRILSHLQAGQELPAVPARLSGETATARLATITEPMAWYEGDSPWGGAIAPPSLVVNVMRPVERGMDLRRNRAVGLFGAIEVRHLDGPVFVERDYEVAGRLLAVGETPKSEYVWYESVLSEPGTGRGVAAMIMMLRFMKASSPLWTER